MPGSASQDDRRISLEGELTDEIKIDTSLVPEHVRIRKIPALGPTSPNDFLTKLFAEYNAKATAEVEQNAVDQAAYEAAMVEGTAIIAGIVDADTANAAMPKYQAIKHALTSNKELGVLWNKKVKECGLFYDKVLKKYTPAPAATGEEKGAE